MLEGSKFIVLLDTNLTQELKEEGLVREFVRAVQTYRKELNLPVELRVDLFVQTDLQIQKVLINFDELVQKNLMIHAVHFEGKTNMRSFRVEGNEVQLYIESGD